MEVTVMQDDFDKEDRVAEEAHVNMGQHVHRHQDGQARKGPIYTPRRN